MESFTASNARANHLTTQECEAVYFSIISHNIQVTGDIHFAV